MSVAQHIPDENKRVSRTLGYALWLDDWSGVSLVLRARLDKRQRAALAFMALKSLDDDDALHVAEAALCGGAGQPLAPLFNHMDEAAFWADMAEPAELDAYCLAAFNRMSDPRKAAFLDFVQGRAAA